MFTDQQLLECDAGDTCSREIVFDTEFTYEEKLGHLMNALFDSENKLAIAKYLLTPEGKQRVFGTQHLVTS